MSCAPACKRHGVLTFDRSRVRALRSAKRSLRKRALFRKFGEHWKAQGEAFQRRSYDSYDDYLEHQKAKLETHDFGQYDEEFRRALRRAIKRRSTSNGRAATFFASAARIGTEVKAFLDLGAFAVGIDLNPGKENRYVVQGDFHDLHYAPELDRRRLYQFSRSRVRHRADRQRSPESLETGWPFSRGGRAGRDQGVNPGFFESFFWKNIDELGARI